ncbi:CD1247 N-terminal domain-containing protein [Calditerricola satsumensis]|uniref:AraC family transcriptional regulator n=1 Tax=Calditerricola satsumensis TaxID=373054 RepID=A0A8J3BA12_9BACI|nr:CD1247 N-terminal domain-containing protein [Calditerricola satsumensis]GGJ99909.1 hypothetical protein GCM10007043_12490 [Calditerricola satsumensis]
MEQLETRVAYLRGLAEGMDVKGSEGRILEEMIRVMDQMAKRMRELEERVDDQEAYLEALDEDLTDVEAYVYGEEEDEEAEDALALECPNCEETVLLDDDVLTDDVDEVCCPACGETLLMVDGADEAERVDDAPRAEHEGQPLHS